ncbi:hypothetical protein [uncultured Pseudodesulfovibrio sp.]|uniref:hypothetical protein n=1 Tax=uncultured Pseudodesulfovibrio sp. TaxID=2035858 RepID=UPI0029C99293|nr:hypothetical protein [uncultured Pseudodesulfovibrio sp.]
MSAFKGDHITVQYEMHLDFPAEKIWPQLCPIREYDWIEDWECEMLHSESGFNERGCVFRTNVHTEGGPDIWLTCRFDPMEQIEFVRTNAWRIAHYIIELEPAQNGTRLIWTQHVTALNEEGNEYVKQWPDAFKATIIRLEKMLAHFLATGTMLRGDDKD